MIFFCKLLPPRQNFGTTMSEAEQELMGQHAMYWHSAIANGQALGFGAVADPRGFFGVAFVSTENISEARAFTDLDPVILAGVGFEYEIHVMPLGFAIARAEAEINADV